MKMQQLIAMLALSTAMGVFAANEQEGMKPGTMMGMMNHEQMTQMREHMQEIQEVMAAIKAENNPERRMEMMQEHKAKMNEAMGMMGGAMMGRPEMRNEESMNMEERMAMMQNQMGMMGMMMQQMMEHFSTGEGLHGE